MKLKKELAFSSCWLKSKKNAQKHGYHLVDPSPWPIIASLFMLLLTLSTVLYMHGYSSSFLLKYSFIFVIFTAFIWWFDIIREGTYEGRHTQIVRRGLRIGMILFIVSEIMFFVSFFIAYFYSSFNPTFLIGSVWPPIFTTPIPAIEIPALNTLLLLTSGIFVTLAHNFMFSLDKQKASAYLLITISLAVAFTLFQAYEYVACPFNITDSVYASCFFLLTAFHGFHVIVGTIFLGVCFIRIYLNHFTNKHHLGLEAACWYWHFVDIVWILLYIIVYWWGGRLF